MKKILYSFFLSIMFFSCTIVKVSKNIGVPDPNINYIKLRSGEKIENLTLEQWKLYYKTNKMKIGNRTIENDSIQWLSNTDGLVYNLSNGMPVWRIVEGKVSVYSRHDLASRKSPVSPSSLPDHYYETSYYVKKGNGPMMSMGIPMLKDLLAD